MGSILKSQTQAISMNAKAVDEAPARSTFPRSSALEYSLSASLSAKAARASITEIRMRIRGNDDRCVYKQVSHPSHFLTWHFLARP